MAYQVGYWTELKGIALDDPEEMVSTFQAIPYGEYDHPMYGKIDFTPEKVDDVVQNFNARVRGTDLDIDYDHKSKTGEAAGWVKAAEKRNDGLWLTVKWTKTAWEKIKEGAYRYFSPEFADEWKHPKTKQVHKNVLFGGGITNRPFLKDILPLNMSELFAEQKEGTGMDPKKLRKLLGLPEDATDEQVETALQERPKEGEQQDPPKSEDKKDDKTKEPESQPKKVAATEGLPKEVIQLAENNPAVKALADMVVNLQQTVTTQGAALQLAEANNRVVKLSEPVNGRRLPTTVTEKLTEILVSAPKELGDKVVEAFEALNKAGYVELGEKGGNKHDSDPDAVKKFNDAVQKVIQDDKLDYGAAVELVSSRDPELFEEYRQQSYAFREN